MSAQILVVLVGLWWSALLVWRFGPVGTSRVWWALAAFALSATLYIPPVARAAAALVGSAQACNLFENLWGVAVSGLVVAAVLWSVSAAVRWAAIAITAALVAGLFYLAQATTASPVGCIANLDLPPTNLFWWILLIVHIGSSAVAAYVCAGDARALQSVSRTMALGVYGLALGFSASVLFWGLMLITFLTGNQTASAAATGTVFPVTVIAMTASTVLIAGQRLGYFARSYRELSQAWQEYVEQHRTVHPAERVPSHRSMTGRWWRHPEHVLHQLRIQTADLQLLHRAQQPSPAATTSRDNSYGDRP